MARGSRDVLKLLANGTNREILSLLRAEPTYPRRLAELVGITEGEAQKRLRQMEEHGLVKGQWVHVGKNVKRYTLQASALRIEVGPDGLALALEGGRAEPVKLAVSQEAVPGAEHVVGRAAELSELRRLLDEKGAAVVVGIAGTGKTSLAARFARSQARPVFWSTLRGIEGAPQLLSRFAVFLGARGQQESVASLVHLDGTHDLNAQMAVVAEGLGRVGALVVVDDVHLARDDALRQVLGFLAERAQGHRLLLVGRSLPKGLPRARLAVLSLGGLDGADTGAFLAAKGLAARAGEARAVHAKTGGHPLALTLLAETARGRGVGAGELAALLPETRIEAYLWDEVFSELGQDERDFLSCVSVVRGPLDLALAEAVSGDARARERFYALERRSLCTPVGDGEAVHDVVRRFAVRFGKGRAEAHARAARAMEERGGVSDGLEALHHWLEAGDAEGALALVRREHEERRYRFADMGFAAAYAELLEALAPKAGTERGLALLELAACRLTVGAIAESKRVLAEAGKALGPRAPPRLRAQAVLLQATAHYREAEYPAAARAFARALDLAAGQGDEALLADAEHGRAGAEEDLGHTAASERAYTKALQHARKLGDLRRVALAEGGLARTALQQDKFPAALRHIERGLEAAQAFDDVRAITNLHRSRGEYWLWKRDYDRAWEAVQDYLRSARRLGDPWSVSCALVDAAWVAHHRGRWDDVQGLVDEVEAIDRRTPLPFFAAQGGALRVVAAAARQDWPRFEALARAQRGDVDFMWFYSHLFIEDLRRVLPRLLTEDARPMVERLLAERGRLVPWLREALEAWADGTAPAAAPARKRAAPRAVRARAARR